MELNLRNEDILFRVRELLNKCKIKLWLEPYYHENEGVGSDQEQALQALCEDFTQKLNIDHEQCNFALRKLQSHALDRLNSNEIYKETGVASLKVKVSGDLPQTLTVNIILTANAAEFIEEVSKMIEVPEERIKLISAGKVIKPEESLASQGVKNNAQLMAVILAKDNSLQEAEKRFKTLENTKKDVELLASRSNRHSGEHYFQLENQNGEAVSLPYHERTALVTAMALHEKGRAALKKEDYSLALVYFLEADKEYSECTSEILQLVDNYALLNLDIAWCYLCLRNPAQIPDADRRLSLSEQSFQRTYGPNLERLMAIKGSTGNEAALFMRLHLLQGVVCFHQNKRAEARALFERAQGELNGLKLDDNSLSLLLELGFSSSEARLALRATHGNVESAEELIHRKREEKKLARERNRLKLQNERERIKLGLCSDGKQYCEPAMVDKLVEMGFDRCTTITALKLTNNSLTEAINLIQNQPNMLQGSSQSRNISQDAIAQVTSLGIDPETAREALEKFPELEETMKSLTSLAQGASNSEAFATATSSALSYINEFCKKRKEREEEENEAFARVSEGLIGKESTEEHLDLNLAQEENFLVEYLSLLNN